MNGCGDSSGAGGNPRAWATPVREPVRLLLCSSCVRARGLVGAEDWRELAMVVACGLCDDCRAAYCACDGGPTRLPSRCIVTVGRGFACPRRSNEATAIVAKLFIYERAS